MLCAHALILFNKFSCFCDISDMHRTIVKFVYLSMYIIKAWELSYFKDCYFRKVGVFHLICHVWLSTRQELEEMVDRDVIGG